MSPACACKMYQINGICWHTGYKPRFISNTEANIYKAAYDKATEILNNGNLHPTN